MTGRVKGSGRIAGALVATAVVSMVAVGPVWAHGDEDEEGTEAFQFVRQAIALVVNTPDDHDAIADKIADALDAADDHGVDLALVGDAQAALETEDLHQTRTLLESSIGARPHLVADDPGAAGDHLDGAVDDLAPADEVAAPAILDPLDTRRDLSSGDWVIVAAALAAIGLGTTAAVRLRPEHRPTS